MFNILNSYIYYHYIMPFSALCGIIITIIIYIFINRFLKKYNRLILLRLLLLIIAIIFILHYVTKFANTCSYVIPLYDSPQLTDDQVFEVVKILHKSNYYNFLIEKKNNNRYELWFSKRDRPLDEKTYIEIKKMVKEEKKVP